MNNIVSYLKRYQNISLKEKAFNEVDAAIFAELSYPKIDKFIKPKETIKASKLLKRINKLKDKEDKDYKLDFFIDALKANRFNNPKVLNYVSHHDKDAMKQFQAITFIIKNMMIISFAGTDSSLEGLKEDMNMSFLTITPGEVEAIEYLRKARNAHPHKKIYLVGHSKGGRLAITSAKALENKKKIEAIYCFDSPNYESFFYDDEYLLIKDYIHHYNPEKSIIGRLIEEPKKVKIVASKYRYWQHNIFSWYVIDDHFETVQEYNKNTSRLVKSINHALKQYTLEEKYEFSQNVFNIVEHLPFVNKGKGEVALIQDDEKPFLSKMELLKTLMETTKELKEETKSVLKIIFSVILGSFKSK